MARISCPSDLTARDVEKVIIWGQQIPKKTAGDESLILKLIELENQIISKYCKSVDYKMQNPTRNIYLRHEIPKIEIYITGKELRRINQEVAGVVDFFPKKRLFIVKVKGWPNYHHIKKIIQRLKTYSPTSS